MSFHGDPSIFVSEIHLKVRNLDQAFQFYTNILGLKVLSKTENFLKLTVDGKKALVNLEVVKDAELSSGRKTGLYHFALLLPNRTELANVLYHLLETKYPLQGASDHLVSEAIYLADPEGNGIELYVDRPSRLWQKENNMIEMATHPLDAQDLLNQRTKEKFSGLPIDTIMGHIHLQVANIQSSESFYKALGFDVVNRYGEQAIFISTGGYHHHIGLNTWRSSGATPPSDKETGLKSFTLKFPSEDKRNEVIENLHKIGYGVITKGETYLTEDPSRNVMLLTI